MFARNFFKGGTKVPHFKNTAECETVKMGVPERCNSHASACRSAVWTLCKKGDSVRVGQVIGNSDKYISSPIHSSVSGTVNDVAPMLFAGGIYVTAVEIKTDGKQEIYEGIKPPSFSNSKEFISAIRESGLVDLAVLDFRLMSSFHPSGQKDWHADNQCGWVWTLYNFDYREIIEIPGTWSAESI